MNKSKIKRVLCMMISIVIILSISVFNVSAEPDELAEYRAVLSRFNTDHGTNYQLATEQQLENIGVSNQEFIAFITSMSEEEFWDYLCYVSTNEIATELNENSGPKRVSPIAKIQRYYYTGNTNRCVYLKTTYLSVDGHNRYSTVTGFGAEYSAYPAQVPTSYNAQITNNSTQVYVTYVYDYYLSKYITDAAYHTGNVTFSVNGGNVYGSSGGTA